MLWNMLVCCKLTFVQFMQNIDIDWSKQVRGHFDPIPCQEFSLKNIQNLPLNRCHASVCFLLLAARVWKTLKEFTCTDDLFNLCTHVFLQVRFWSGSSILMVRCWNCPPLSKTSLSTAIPKYDEALFTLISGASIWHCKEYVARIHNLYVMRPDYVPRL